MIYTGSNGSGSLLDAKDTKKRTRVACETCRRKKIKCSGENPCLNCIQLKEAYNCKYAEKVVKETAQTKPKVNKRTSSVKAMRVMEDRMARLEGFLMRMSDKLDYINNGTGSTATAATTNGQNTPEARNGVTGRSSQYSSSSAEDSESEDDQEEEEDDDENDKSSEIKDQAGAKGVKLAANDNQNTQAHQIKPKESPLAGKTGLFSIIQGRRGSVTQTQKESSEKFFKSIGGSEENFIADEDVLVYSMREQFFDSHSFLSVCSQKSMEWIAKSLAPEKTHVLDQFNRFPFYYLKKCNTVLSKWINPKVITPKNYNRIIDRPLLEDGEYIYTLVTTHLLSLPHVEFLVSFKKLLALIDAYYSGKRMSSSQILVLIASVHISISAKLGHIFSAPNAKGTEKSTNPESRLDPKEKEILSRVSDYELSKFQDGMMDSAIAHYHRISVICLGLDTIRGILLLCIALEAAGLPDVDYMLLSVAIRYAQEMGLHRPESYVKLSPEEATERRNIWGVCQHVDIEFSFRNGKPPVLSAHDIARASANDLSLVIDLLAPRELIPVLQEDITFNPDLHTYHVSTNSVNLAYEKGCYMFIILYFDYLLLRVRSKSYNKLFLSVGNLKSVENLENILEGLNNDILNISNAIVPEFRPQFYDEPGFFDIVDKMEGDVKEHLVEAYCMFFFHLTLTNRVPFIIDASADSEKIATFRKIHIRSARTLLHILLRLEFDGFKTFSLNWLSFYPLAAFLMLLSNCMNNPRHPETAEDIDLLTKLSIKMFNFKSCFKRTMSYVQKSDFAAIIMKLFVQLVIAVVESQTKTTISPNAEHEKQLRELRLAVPELYNSKPVEFEIQIQSSLDHRENLSTVNSTVPSSTNSSGGRSFQNSPNTDPAAHSIFKNNGVETGIYQCASPSNHPSLPNLVNQTSNGGSLNVRGGNHPSRSPSRLQALPIQGPEIPFRTQSSPGFSPNPETNFPIPFSGGTPHELAEGNNFNGDAGPGSNPSSTQSPNFFGSNGFIGDDSIGNIVNNQINQLPNFFFDNNMGF